MKRNIIACIFLTVVSVTSAGCEKGATFDMNKQAIDVPLRYDTAVSDEIRYNETRMEQLDGLHDAAIKTAGEDRSVDEPAPQ
ncbi:MAG: hypothetical protein WC551_12405 [Patescibacteria group bacterium]